MEETISNYKVTFPYGKLDLVNQPQIPSDLRKLIENASKEPDLIGLYVFGEMTGNKYPYSDILKHFESLEKMDLLVLYKK
jgi:hypothetical protein